jgi:hypothetical protein
MFRSNEKGKKYAVFKQMAEKGLFAALTGKIKGGRR